MPTPPVAPTFLHSEPILSATAIRAIDAHLERAGLLELAMEEAGRAGADALQADALQMDAVQTMAQGRVLVLAGSGANGGDALVLARHLVALGREIEVLALPSKHPLTRLSRRRLRAYGVAVGTLQPATLRRALAQAGVVVDGLLGTGFMPPLRPALREMIAALNASQKPVLALDLPSGLVADEAQVPVDTNAADTDAADTDAADTNAADTEVVRATLTVTFCGPKPALIYGPAAHLAGRIEVAPLRLPPQWAMSQAIATRPTLAEVAALLPVRFADAHKGTAGHIWVVGGHPGTVGAAGLAGLGALRAGAGLVTVLSEAEVPLVTPELMMRRVPDLLAYLEASAQPATQTQSQRPDALCIGMGLGPQAAALAREVLAWKLPTVLDADALQPELAGAGHDHCIWTPHPGEAARLLGVSTAEIVRDPIGAARRLQQQFGGVVVLKGGPSTIAHAGGVWVSRGGHPGMATAGMGDTLSGVLVALLGQGMTAEAAALAGVTLHARAGELAGARHGYGLIASDVSAELGAAWHSLLAERA